MEKKKGYIRVAEPNKDELAELLKLAKGNGRTMKQFAEECGVNPSTFSRIANKMNRGASSDELIMAIAEHADPESNITLDDLMAAHGMARIIDNTKVCRTSKPKLEQHIVNAVLHELKKLGDADAEVCNSRFTVGSFFRYSPDFIIRTEVIEGESDLWVFDILPLYSPESPNNFPINTIGRRIIERIGRILPLFYNDQENCQLVGKFSYVITDKVCFNYIKSEFANYVVPFNMSFIWFDMDRGGVEQEFILPQPGKCISDSIFSNF